MIRVLREFVGSLTFNKVVIFLFLLIYCGCYYQEYLSYISFSYLLLFVGTVYNFVKHKKVIHLQFILVALLFVLYSYFSTLWAVDFAKSQAAVMVLVKSVAIAVCFITLLDSREHVKWALGSFAIAGIVFGLLYIQNVDIASLGANRITTEEGANELLPNVNIVGLFLSLSFVYFTYMFFVRRKYLYLLLAVVIFVLIFLLGARKSIFSLFICLLMLFWKLRGSSKLLLIFLVAGCVALLFVYIPPDYLQFVSERLAQLNFFQSNMNELDASDRTRVQLLTSGIEYCFSNPICGHGYYNFSQLFYRDFMQQIYSHNNFIETFVGGGIIAFVLYYYQYWIVWKRSFVKRCSLCDNRYLLLMLLVVLLFNHLTIVLLQERFIWILLSILYVATYYFKIKNLNENRVSC